MDSSSSVICDPEESAFPSNKTTYWRSGGCVEDKHWAWMQLRSKLRQEQIEAEIRAQDKDKLILEVEEQGRLKTAKEVRGTEAWGEEGTGREEPGRGRGRRKGFIW